jgi:hypothetical protein
LQQGETLLWQLVQVVLGLGSGYADLGSGVYRLSVRRHTAYNLLGSIIPLGISLVTILIWLIGEARYEVLVTEQQSVVVFTCKCFDA